MATDLDLVRDHVGDGDPSDAEILQLLAEYNSPYVTAQKILERRLANLLDGPASFSVTGYSENNTKVIESLEKKVERLAGITGVDRDTAAASSSQLTRADRRCR